MTTVPDFIVFACPGCAAIVHLHKQRHNPAQCIECDLCSEKIVIPGSTYNWLVSGAFFRDDGAGVAPDYEVPPDKLLEAQILLAQNALKRKKQD
jgi:hypothetical protein